MTGRGSAYAAADGGWGAALLVALRRGAPALVPVDSLRHAEPLLVVRAGQRVASAGDRRAVSRVPAPRRALVIASVIGLAARPVRLLPVCAGEQGTPGRQDVAREVEATLKAIMAEAAR